MKIVIDIPDRLIKKVKDHYVNPYEVDEICEAILEGTPLPEQHGRLVDADWVKNTLDIYVIREYEGLTFLDMREATEEERSSLKRYIDSISQPTGVKFDFYGVKTELEPCEDCVSRQAVLDKKELVELEDGQSFYCINPEDVETLQPVTPQQRWIPVSERLPKDLEPVNITWVNHNPESYYANIKDKPFTATGVYFNGQWYWWSTLCIDILAEYSHNYDDIIDGDIEIIAWMPLPQPYKAEMEGDND